jgi:hypothetical protein
MDERYLELYRTTLNDAIGATDDEYKDLLMDSIQYMIQREGEGVAVNFVLYTFYTSDKMSTKYHLKGFQHAVEQGYFLRMLLIEQGMERLYADLERTDLYLKAIDVYKSAVNHA